MTEFNQDFDSFIKKSVLKPGGYKYSQNQIDHYKQQLQEKKDYFAKQKSQNANQVQQNYINQENKFQDENNEYSQQQLFQKLGINPNYNAQNDPYEQQSYKFSQAKYLESQLGVPESYIYSTKMEGVKGQVQGELLSEVEKEIERVRQRRQNLMDRKNLESKQNLPYSYHFEKKKKTDEYEPQDVEEVINFQWKNNQPTFEEVEEELQRHRNKIKQYEQQLGKQPLTQNNNQNENKQENLTESQKRQQRLIFLQNNEPKIMVDNLLQNERVKQFNLSGIHKDILEYGGYNKDSLYKENNFIQSKYQNQQQTNEEQQQYLQNQQEQQEQNQQKQKITQIQPKYMQENKKQMKNRVIKEEMKAIEEKINREAYEHFLNGTKPPKINKAIKQDSTKVIRKSSKEKKYLEEFQNYKLQKKTEEIVKIVQQQDNKPQFERFKKPKSYNTHMQNVKTIQNKKLSQINQDTIKK